MRSAASGRRPSSGTRSRIVENGDVEPDDGAVAQHQLPVARIDDGAAAGGDDRAALRQERDQLLALDGAEVRLALLPEDGRDVAPLALLDPLVDVLGLPVEPPRQRARDAWSCRRP